MKVATEKRRTENNNENLKGKRFNRDPKEKIKSSEAGELDWGKLSSHS